MISRSSFLAMIGLGMLLSAPVVAKASIPIIAAATADSSFFISSYGNLELRNSPMTLDYTASGGEYTNTDRSQTYVRIECNAYNAVNKKHANFTAEIVQRFRNNSSSQQTVNIFYTLGASGSTWAGTAKAESSVEIGGASEHGSTGGSCLGLDEFYSLPLVNTPPAKYVMIIGAGETRSVKGILKGKTDAE